MKQDGKSPSNFSIFRKNRGLCLINVMGLTVSMTVASLAFLFVQYELSVDQFHHKIDGIYRLVIVGKSRGRNSGPEYRTDIITGRSRLLRKYTEVADVVRMLPWPGKIEHNKSWIRENRFWFTDPNIFNMLTLPLLQGNPHTVLHGSHSVVITPSMAKKYFGNADPIGKTLKIHMSTVPALYSLKVTGILKPVPKASSLHIDFLAHIPFEKLTSDLRAISGTMNQWVYAMTFMELVHPSARNLLEEKLGGLYCHDPDKTMSMEHMRFEIEPFKHAYLKSKAVYSESFSNFRRGHEPIQSSDIHRSIFIAVMGCAALIFSVINFIQSPPVRPTRRFGALLTEKEGNPRRRRLMSRLISDALIISYSAVLPALFLTGLLLPSFCFLMRMEVDVHHLWLWAHTAGGVAGMATFIGLLSGVCRAAFYPTPGSHEDRKPSFALFRQGFMQVQISACVLAFLVAVVMLDGIQAPKKRDLGFNAKNLMYFQLDDRNLAEFYPAFKKEILQIPGVINVTAGNALPCRYDHLFSLAYYHDDAVVVAHTLFADSSFLETCQIPLADGEGFSTQWEEMPGYVIINEKARQILQSNGVDPLHRAVAIPYLKNFWQHRVQGIMRNCCWDDSSESIQPLAILPSSHLSYLRNIVMIRLKDREHAETLVHIEKTVNRFYPRALFDYRYVDEEMEEKHAEVMLNRRLALAFVVGLTLCITAVGLFGLAVHETTRCNREIGIRKALGANPGQIAVLFLWRFVRWTLPAQGVAWLIGSFGIHQIFNLMDCSPTVQIRLAHYLLSGLLTLAFTLLAVGVPVCRASLTNPAKALRYEPPNTQLEKRRT